MDISHIIQILLSTLITIITAIIIYHNRKIEGLEKDRLKIMVDIEKHKTDRSVEFGKLTLQIEQMKSLIRDELHETRQAISKEMNGLRENIFENFVQKDRR